MKIAIVHFVIDPGVGGGMAVKTVALSRALAAAGHSVVLITTDVGLGRRPPPPPLPDVEVVILATRWRRFPIPRTSTAKLAAKLRGCDAALIMNHWTALNAVAAAAARRIGVPYVFCPGGALAIQGRSTRLKRLYQALVGRRLIAGARVVLATTPLEARQFEAADVPSSKIAVIPNGVRENADGHTAADFRRAHDLGDAPFLLFVGRLNPIKGPDLLLDGFARVAGEFPAWQLVFAGPDEGLASSLRARVETLGLSARVHLCGLLSQPAATGAYRAADLLVVPSRHEAMSQVALEAAVTGTPVLLTAACGFDEVERVGGGRVVPATAGDLAAGLRDLLSRPEDLPAMGQRLRAFVLQEYGWTVIVRRYVDLLQSIRR